MPEWITEMFGIPLYVFEGYCIQFLFRGFAEPKLQNPKGSRWAVGAAWIAIRILSRILFRDLDSRSLVWALLFSSIALFGFCLCWYECSSLWNAFWVIQFIALHELVFWAGYSLLYLGNIMLDCLVKRALSGAVPMQCLPMAAVVLSCFFVALMETVQGALLLFSIKKIVRSCHCRENGKMDGDGVFCLLPAIAGVLVAVLVRLLMIVVEEEAPVLLYEKYPILYFIVPMIALILLAAIVFSFQIYQNMAALQEERAEKIILENQIMQMQNSMMEMEHLYDKIRAAKHDMKNHMAVLQNLMQKRHQSDCEEDEEIRHYFEGMYQSVEQLETKVHTGNAVSDVVIGNKFCYAKKAVKDIKLDASGFMMTDAIAIKAYDIGIILNNGLDNAIEACIKMREKCPDEEAYITIRSFRAKNMCFIEIENSFDGMILFHKDSGLPISTKEDKEVHGIGLKNIKKCAVKYGGDMDCIVKGNRFILSVMVKS